MPFDPDKFLAQSAGGFDPDAFLGTPPRSTMQFIPDQAPPVRAENVILGASQALPVGEALAPASAAIERGIAHGRTMLDPLLGPSETAQQTLATPPEALAQETRSMLQTAEQQPGFQAGKLGAQILGTAALPAVRGAQVAVGGLMGGAEGARVGGLPGAVAGATAGAGMSAIFAAGPAAFKSLAKTSPVQALQAAGQGLQDIASRMSVRLLKLTKGERGTASSAELHALGKMLIENKFTTGGAGLAKVADRVEGVVARAGKQIASAYEQVGAKEPLGLAAQDVRSGVLQKFSESPLFPPEASGQQQAVTILDDLIAGSPAKEWKTPDLWRLARRLEEKGYTFTGNQSTATENATGEIYRGLAKQVRDMALERAGAVDPKLGVQIMGANSVYSELAGAHSALQSTLKTSQFGAGHAVRHTIGETVVNTLTGGTPTKTAAISTLYGAGRALKGAARSSTMSGIDKLWSGGRFASKAFSAALNQAKNRGPAAVASTHYSLMQTSPEYRAAFEEATADDE